MLKRSLTPSDLAADLATARFARDEAVKRAEEKFSGKRAAVIEAGTTRVEQIRQLRVELDIEENALVGVLNEA